MPVYNLILASTAADICNLKLVIPNMNDPKQFPTQSMATSARTLSLEEAEKIARDTTLVAEFKQNKLEKEAQRNWDLFYKRNKKNFFKDRHWTTREFTELCGQKVEEDDERRTILEVGCGVGNFMFPLLAEVHNIYFYACDFSPRAVQFVKDSACYDPSRCCVFKNDLTTDDLTHHIEPETVDIVTMIFVLSAIHPERMVKALCNIYSVLRPGGFVLIRDYGLYDHAMLRFAPGHKLSDNFYVRQDGTRAYYFSQERLSAIFSAAGFMTITSDYILRETVNKKEGLCVPRVFVQGKFSKRTDISETTEVKGNNMTNGDCLHLHKKPKEMQTPNSDLSSEPKQLDSPFHSCGLGDHVTAINHVTYVDHVTDVDHVTAIDQMTAVDHVTDLQSEMENASLL